MGTQGECLVAGRHAAAGHCAGERRGKMSEIPMVDKAQGGGRSHEWIEAARCGDATALGRGFEAERAYLRRFAASILPAEVRRNFGASDLVQQTFLNAKRYFAGFQGECQAQWRAWLKVTLRNVLAARRRRLQKGLAASNAWRTGRRELIDPGPTPAHAAIRGERMNDLLRAVNQLPDQYRNVVLWRHVDGLSFKQIAERLNKPSAGAVEKVHRRALVRLKRSLGPGYDFR
jgi:RNA polymerase sigma-70 factor, ECF subfamily